MATYKATSKKKDTGSNVFKATERKSYDSSYINRWEEENEEARSILDDYITRRNKGDWFSEEEVKEYQSAFDRYKSSSKSLAEVRKSFGAFSDEDEKGLDTHISDFSSDLDSIYKLSSQFKSRDEYDQAIKDQEEYEKKKTLDLDATHKEIKELEVKSNEYSKIKKQRDTLYGTIVSGWLRAGNSREAAEAKALQDSRIAKYDEQLSDYEIVSKELSEKKVTYKQAKRIQEGIRLSGVADPESEFYNPEFNSFGVVNDEHADDDKRYKYINDIDGFRKSEDSFWADHNTYTTDTGLPFPTLKPNYIGSNYEHLNEHEINIYNYYYNKEGSKKANEYLDLLQETLNHRAATKMFDGMEGDTGVEILFGIEAGLDQFSSGLENLFNTEDDYIPTSAVQMASQMVREDLADDSFKFWYNFKDGEWEDHVFGSSVGQVAYDITNTTSNMLPSILVGSVTHPVVGASLLGASAAGNAYQEMLNFGYDKGQARMYSTLVGVSEASLEYLLGGISKLGGKATSGLTTKLLSKVDNALARGAIRFGGSVLSEGFEEGLQEYLDPWFKSIALNTDYEAANLDEILYSGLLGALSAFGLEGPNIISSELATYSKGKKLKTDGEVDRLVELGKTYSADSVAYRIANKVNKDTGAYTIGRLFNEVGASLSESNITDITNALVERHVDQSQAATIAEWMSKVVNGAELTETQQASLENNPVLAEVLYGTIIQPNSTVMQRSQAVNDLYGIESSVGVDKELSEKPQTPEAITQRLAEKRAEGDGFVRGTTQRSGLPSEQLSKIDDFVAKSRTAIPESNYQDVGQSSYKPSSAKIANTTDKVSDTGATIVKSTGEEVSIKNIVSIDAKNKSMKLELSNGKVVDSKDISYGDEKQAALYESVLLMGYDASTANAIVQGYTVSSPTSVSDYLIGTNEAFNYGWGHISEKARGGSSYIKLTQAERAYAVKLGEDARAADDNAREARVSQNQPQTAKKKAKGSYGARFSVDQNTVTDRVKKSAKALDSVAKALKLNIVIADLGGLNSYGFYKRSTNELVLDVNAGGNGKHTLLFTASHELIHYVRNWSPKKFTVLADFLMEQYAAKGENIDDLIQTEIDKAYKASRGKHKMTYDEAYEEVVAQAMQRFLTDSNFIEHLASLHKKDASLAKRLVSKLKEILNSIRAAYQGMDTNDRASHAVKEMGEAIDELYAKMEEGLLAASEASQSIGERNLEDFSEAKNTNGDTLFQYKAMEADEEAYRQMLKKHGIMSEAEINKLFSTVDKALVIIKNNLEVLDYAWEADIDDRSFSPVKPNSDNLYKVSLDFSTLCRKRILQQVIQTQLQDALNKPISREESIAIRDELMKIQEEGRQIEIACALCYVESARMKSPAQIKKFLKNREAVIKEFLASKSGGDIKQKIAKAEADARKRLGVGNDSLKSMPKKVADEIRLAKREAKKAYTPTAEEQRLIDAASSMTVTDFTSPEGLSDLAKNYPVLFDAYTSYVRNATKSKGIEKDTWWRAGDSDSIGDTLIANMNKENGLRSQSWSDFQVIHLLDYIAATIELSTRNAKEQAYSKVPDYIDLMGNTGVMLNMSLIPTAQFNGKLEYDSVEGMAYKKALELRDKYHATAGTICIGISNEQIKMLLDDSTIDYVIPYHKSGMAAHIRKLMHIPTWSEYEKYQNETELPRDDAQKQAKKYGVTLLSESDPNYHKHTAFSEWFDIEEARQIAKQENAFPTDANLRKKLGVMYGGYMAMKNAANNYLKLCAERGIAPKFSHENANFSEEANYWKLIIDRKMVDNVTGEVIEQQAIKPIFDEGEVLRILNDELKRYPDVKADQDYAARTVVEKFLSGKMNDRLDADTVAAIMQKPVDNITSTNILSSATEIKDFDSSKEKIEANIQDVAKMSSVYDVDKSNLEKTGKRPSDIFEEYFKKWGYRLHSDELGDISAERSSIKSEIRHGITAEKIASIEAIPTVIKEGKVIFTGTKPNSDVQRIVVCAPIKIGNTPYYMGVMLQRDTKTQRLYLHNVAIEKEASNISQVDLLTTGTDENNEYLFVTSILQNALAVKYRNNNPELDDVSHQYIDPDTDLAPTFYSQMGKVVEGVKQEKLAANSVVNMLRGKGVKAEEIRWSGIVPFLEGKKSVTKAELLDFINGSMLQIGEQMSSNDIDLRYDSSSHAYIHYDAKGNVVDTYTYSEFLDGYVSEVSEEIYSNPYELEDALREEYGKMSSPRWAEYKLDGGENYREIVFTLPNSSYSNQMMRVHWGDDAEGVLVHARIQDFDVNGKKMLFVEEIQSDYHNEGHQTGYNNSETDANIDGLKAVAEEKFFALEDYSTEMTGNAGEWETIEKTEKGAKLLREYREAQDAHDSAMNEYVKKIPDTPFKDTYHEYVMKRLLRMAAEEGYDSIGWTPAYIQSERWSDEFAEGYRIEYDQDIPKFLRKYGRQWGATVGKTAIAKETVEGKGRILKETELANVKRDIERAKKELARKYDSYEKAVLQRSIDSMEKTVASLEHELSASLSVWSMDITDSMKNSVLYEGQVMYQYKDEDSIDNRTLLAKSLEGAAKTDMEKQKLKEYQSKIDLINSEEKKLRELRSEIKEISFSKGKRDTEKLKKLQFEANQSANRINVYDKQLLNLEATKPLKDVLQREKDLVRKKMEKDRKEAVKAAKQKEMETIRELMDRHTESRKKAIEGRNRTQMRHKIKKVVNDLDQLLRKGSKERNVKFGLQSAVASALKAINMDTVAADERVAKYDALIAKAKDPDVIESLTEKRDRIQNQGDVMKEKLEALKEAYTEIEEKGNEVPEYYRAETELIKKRIESVIQKVGNTPLRNMTLSQLESVYELYSMVLATVRNANSVFIQGKLEDLQRNASATMDELSEVKKRSEERLNTSWADSFSWNEMIPVYAFKRMGSKTFEKFFWEAIRGQNTVARDLEEANDFASETRKKYGYKKWVDTIEVGYKCDCSAKRMQEKIKSLGKAEILRMLDEQVAEEKPRELTAICRFCNSEYTFTEKELL